MLSYFTALGILAQANITILEAPKEPPLGCQSAYCQDITKTHDQPRLYGSSRTSKEEVILGFSVETGDIENLPQETPSLSNSHPIYPVPGNLDALIDTYAARYGADPNLMKSIARCESTFNPNAVNGPYGGMYQYITSTWVSTREKMGLDTNPDLRFNAEEAIKTTAYKLAHGGKMAWKDCLQ